MTFNVEDPEGLKIDKFEKFRLNFSKCVVRDGTPLICQKYGYFPKEALVYFPSLCLNPTFFSHLYNNLVKRADQESLPFCSNLQTNYIKQH